MIMFIFAVVCWLAIGWIGCLLANAYYWRHFHSGIDSHMWGMAVLGPINLIAVGIAFSWSD